MLITQIGVFSYQYECCHCHETAKDVSIGLIDLNFETECEADITAQKKHCCTSHKSGFDYKKQDQDLSLVQWTPDFTACELELFKEIGFDQLSFYCTKNKIPSISDSPPIIYEERIQLTCQYLI